MHIYVIFLVIHASMLPAHSITSLSHAHHIYDGNEAHDCRQRLQAMRHHYTRVYAHAVTHKQTHAIKQTTEQINVSPMNGATSYECVTVGNDHVDALRHRRRDRVHASLGAQSASAVVPCTALAYGESRRVVHAHVHIAVHTIHAVHRTQQR